MHNKEQVAQLVIRGLELLVLLPEELAQSDKRAHGVRLLLLVLHDYVGPGHAVLRVNFLLIRRKRAIGLAQLLDGAGGFLPHCFFFVDQIFQLF